jgi:RNase P subunit RPR2
MSIKHGFMEIVYYEEEAIECTDNKCERLIVADDMCFVDVQEGGKIYCKSCGTCERYHRKKETERNAVT